MVRWNPTKAHARQAHVYLRHGTANTVNTAHAAQRGALRASIQIKLPPKMVT
jgi:hypothetical protein